MLRIFKVVLFFAWLGVFILLSTITLYGFWTLQSFIYWWVLLGWVLCIWHFKIDSRRSFLSALIFFIISVLITTISPIALAEILMRISFLFLTTGFFQALFEYRNEKST